MEFSSEEEFLKECFTIEKYSKGGIIITNHFPSIKKLICPKTLFLDSNKTPKKNFNKIILTENTYLNKKPDCNFLWYLISHENSLNQSTSYFKIQSFQKIKLKEIVFNGPQGFLKEFIKNKPILKFFKPPTILEKTIILQNPYLKISDINNLPCSNLNHPLLFLNLSHNRNINCPISSDIITNQSYCPHCKNNFELSHLIKWLLIKNSCPLCNQELNITNVIIKTDGQQKINKDKKDLLSKLLKKDNILIVNFDKNLEESFNLTQYNYINNLNNLKTYKINNLIFLGNISQEFQDIIKSKIISKKYKVYNIFYDYEI